MSGKAMPGREPALAPEAVVRLRVNGVFAVSWSCTPHALEPLAAGWLACEGILQTREDLREIGVETAGDGESTVVTVTLDPAAERRLKRLPDSSEGATTGPEAPHAPARSAGKPTTSPGSWTPEIQTLLTDADVLAGLFREMFGEAPVREAIGGMHTGGLVLDGSLTAVVEDVSRHHVVDRLVGTAVLSHGSAAGSILILSSRISGAMAAKACRAGVTALVSRSIPTDLAARTARRCGLVLVGRARRGAPQVHWPAG